MKPLPLAIAALLGLMSNSPDLLAEEAQPKSKISDNAEPMAAGKFEPTWTSLTQYQVPDWFRDAKFGMWAHWGPQCQPEDGDWYAREMYLEGSGKYKSHLAHYGHPSKAGFKDIIHDWKAEKWNPDKLIALYKRAGAKYFFALANHHDNLDLWNSKYQPWNSVKVGPQKDLIAGWAKAARDNGLPFGVSVHAAHAWSWYEAAQGADKKGPLAGVAYDGKLTKADGQGQWWEGLDPQDLYEQNHTPSPDFDIAGKINGRWNWAGGVTTPDAAYCDKFYNRTVDLINQIHPDMVYFDDTGLPLWPVSDAGLRITAHLYNSDMQRHDGKLEALVFGKGLKGDQKKALVWDVERGVSAVVAPEPWQTDTCIGNWHYDRSVYERNGYKSPKTVIQMLADIVSKNGNLLLNVPLRGDGSLDDKEEKVIAGITAWMDVNSESIYSTRPWKVFGEGPATGGAPIDEHGGASEGKGKSLTVGDVRFTTKGDTLYAIVMGVPTAPVQIRSLGTAAKLLDGTIANVKLLGSDEPVKWEQTDAALTVEAPAKIANPGEAATVVFRVDLKR